MVPRMGSTAPHTTPSVAPQPETADFAASVTLRIVSDRAERFDGVVELPLELGRLDPTRIPPDELHRVVPTARAAGRLAIADSDTTDISRTQLRIEPAGPGAVRLVNQSGSIAVRCFERPAIPPGATAEQRLPVTVEIGRVIIELEAAAARPRPAEEVGLQTLALPAPRLSEGPSLFQKHSFTDLVSSLQPDAIDGLVAWWRNVIGVLQSASNSDDFFHKAAQAMVRLVRLDVGAVFLHEQGEWRPAALESSTPTSARPSRSLLARVLQEKRTFWNAVEASVDVLSSMASIDAFVASPILDREERVIGALYGHRSREGIEATQAGISSLEALLVETLACGVAGGLARLEQERSAVARKVQFEQFFTPQLAGELEANPDLLRGRDADVTVLFCDIRNFSGITERLGPAQTMEWVGGVLSSLSDEVAATGGVLVDYIGDELMAMWGAPSPQADHAARACDAARRMLRSLPEINARWEREIGCPTMVGVGVNSATARVGNTGSTRKFKYGPLGNGVNLASRVQGATKYLRVPLVVTGSTRELLDDSYLVRRLCTVQVVNIVEPVDLYELDCAGGDERPALFAAYDEARSAFESGRFAAAARSLGDLLARFPNDGPSLLLLSRAVEHMLDEPKDFSPVWRLPGK